MTPFVFKDVLASVVLFPCLFQVPIVPYRRDYPAFPSAMARPGARLRQCVQNKTTIVGYQKSAGLSSEKYEGRGRSLISQPCEARPPHEKGNEDELSVGSVPVAGQ